MSDKNRSGIRANRFAGGPVYRYGEIGWNGAPRAHYARLKHSYVLSDRVMGLTTAAGIWIVAAIGYGVAAGYY